MKKSTHKTEILSAAVTLAQEQPYYRLTQADIARKAACSKGLVTYHFETMDALRDAVVECAVRLNILRIIGDAIGQRHALVSALPQTTRDAAIREFTN